MFVRSSLVLLPGLLFGACGNSDDGTARDAGNHDAAAPVADARSGSDSDAGEVSCGSLRSIVRDFAISHEDFEVVPENGVVVTGLVSETIVAGASPTLSANPPAAGLITSAATFAQWYADVPGTNITFERDLELTETPAGSGNYVYDSDAYFPIDGEGFGNEGNPHNYHFTTELHASFVYEGGEVFTFRGDDDVWVYVNDRLAIDIGGVHGAIERSVDFDAVAADLGITPGNRYPIDFFQAERHVTGSNFRIETSIACFIIE